MPVSLILASVGAPTAADTWLLRLSFAELWPVLTSSEYRLESWATSSRRPPSRRRRVLSHRPQCQPGGRSSSVMSDCPRCRSSRGGPALPAGRSERRGRAPRRTLGGGGPPTPPPPPAPPTHWGG